MKKLIKLLVGAVATLCVLAGCSNVSMDQVSYKGSDGKCVIQIGVEDINPVQLNSVRNAKRQINPTSDQLKGNIDKFLLTGETTTSGVSSFVGSSAKNISFSGTDPRATVSLDYAVWTLTLTAYKTIGDTDYPVLKGVKTIDLTKSVSEDPIVFNLSAGDLNTAGGLNITKILYTSGDNYATISKIVIGLYDRLYNTVVMNTASTPESTEETITALTNDISYSATNVKPGNYKLAVTFYGENNTKIGYWSDLVIIAPGYIQTIAELNIPDVIMKKPSAPSTVYAYRVVDSEKDGLYKVRIDWADSSTNEENFVINIYKYSSAAADATVTLYKSLGVDAVDGVTEPFFTSGTYAGGSIYAGNTNATIYLPTGELFDVKVQAQNFAGKSAETARTAPTGENPSGFEKYTAAQKINRVLVAYNLNGGTFVSDTKTVIGGFLEEYFTYPETQTYVTGKDVENNDITATGHKLLSIKPASGSVNPKLTYNNHDFNGWRATVTSDTVLNGYSDYKNYSVIATFNLDVNLSYAVASYATFTADEVTITKDVSGTATTVIGGTANLTDEITVTVTIASPSKYDWYQIDLDGTPIYYGASNTFSFTPDSIHGLTAGTKNIVVYARLVGTVDTWVADDYTVTFGN